MITGAIVGGLGSIFTKAVSIYQERQNKKHEIELLKLQIAAKAEETESERVISVAEVDAKIKAASYNHDTKAGKASQWVVNIQKLFRPFTTEQLLIALVIFWIYEPSSRAAITAAVIEMAAAAVMWWFGDRSLRKWTKSNG